jgi:putative chitinase
MAEPLTLEQLQHAMPHAGARAVRFHAPLLHAMREWGIDDTAQRVAMFLAQIAEESGELRYVRELWGPTRQQMRYERDFDAPWQRGDAVNRVAFDLGNTEPGDGHRFCGRGLIQITGRANYARVSVALFGSQDYLLQFPDALEQTYPAARSAAWFWSSRGLNAYADCGDLSTCTRRINGGLTHYDRRMKHWAQAKDALGIV